MSIDDQLSGALRDAAGALPDDAGSWQDVQSRGHQARRRRAGRAGLAIVTVLALGVGTFAATRTDDDAAPVITTPPVPGDLLARVTADGVAKVVVLSAADGRVLREISVDPSLATFGGISASADGATAYVTAGEPDPPTATCSSDITQAPVVASLDLTNGVVTPFVKASAAPIVSLDGRRLAYIAGISTCAAPAPMASTTLGITDLETGGNTRPVEGADADLAIQPIAWNADATELVALGNVGRDETPEIVLLDEVPFDPNVQQLDVPEGFETATYLPDGRLAIAYLRDGVHRIAIADERGRATEELFISDQDGVLIAGSMSADATGRIALQFERGPNRPRSGGVVEVWAPGGATPRMVVPPATSAFEVTGIAWLPASVPQTAPAPIPDGHPRSIVALRGDRFVVLDAGDGGWSEIERPLGPADSVSLLPDGRAAMVTLSTSGSSSCDDGGSEVSTVVLEEPSPSVSVPNDMASARDVAVSPDGQRFAFVETNCGTTSELVVHAFDGTFDQTFAVPSDSELSLGSIAGWSADGSRLVVTLGNQGAREVRSVDVNDTSGDLVGDAVQPADGLGLLDVVPLGSSGRWGAIPVFDADSLPVRFVEYDLTTRAEARVLFAWSDLPTDTPLDIRIAASDATGRHVLFLVQRSDQTSPALYRWSEGDAQPTKVADDIVAADW